MVYLIFSPTDLMPIQTATLEAAREAARVYLGKPDWDDKPVTKVTIYRLESVEVVLTKPICQTCLEVGYFLHGGDFGVSESSPCPDCIDAREIMEAAHD